MRQTRQGGSSLVFILVGVLLAALLVGGVYALRQQTAQKTVVTPEVRNEPAPASSKDKTDKAESTSSNTPTDDVVSQKDETSKDKKEQTAPVQSSAAELPRTGGAETAGVALSVALLSGVIVAYLRSRRAAYLAF